MILNLRPLKWSIIFHKMRRCNNLPWKRNNCLPHPQTHHHLQIAITRALKKTQGPELRVQPNPRTKPLSRAQPNKNLTKRPNNKMSQMYPIIIITAITMSTRGMRSWETQRLKVHRLKLKRTVNSRPKKSVESRSFKGKKTLSEHPSRNLWTNRRNRGNHLLQKSLALE